MTADPKVSPRPWIIRPRCDGALDIVICADCGGVFLLTARHCPGCGSQHWTLLNCAAPVARIEGEEIK